LGTAEHRAVAREAVRKSLVLLKNNDAVLPVARNAKILVAGKSADSLSNQSGGWSITWQGTNNTNADFGGGTTFWEAVKKVSPQATLDISRDGALADASYDVALVVVGERPYAEGPGDIGKTQTLEMASLYSEDLALLTALRNKGVKKIVTVLYSGRPLYANKELNLSDAFVAAWLPGTEGEGLTDVLFRNDDGSVHHDFHGKLSYSWPKSPCQATVNKGDANYEPLFAYGYGLTYAQPQAVGVLDAPTQEHGCGVTPGEGGTATIPLSLFEGGNMDKWVMRLGASSNWGGIDVVQGTNDVTSLQPNEIRANPVDFGGRQWAAVRAVWSGTGQIYMQMQNGAEDRDLRSYFNAEGAVVFETKVDVAPASEVNLSMHCHHPCQGEVKITQTLRDLAGTGWRELAVPLKCFKTMNFELVNTPFLLYTEGELDLTLANIRWEPNRAGNVSCDQTGPGNTVISLSEDRAVYENGISDSALFNAPGGWTADSPGAVTVDPAFDTEGEKVIDVKLVGFQKPKSNGGVALSLKSPNVFDATPIATTGGVEFEVRVLDYGETTQDFWVKMVCQRNAGACSTGDLTTLVGRPAVGTWKTVQIPFAHASYATGWDLKQISSVLEILPAWGDQAGNIHFQLRNVRIKKQLVQ
ncbi:MAG: putative glycoside hydrolase, partial [Cystobacter sp.]